MGQVVFVGLGLDSENGMSLEGMEATQHASRVYAEFYTNPMPNLNLGRLQEKVGREIQVLTRHDLEDDDAREIIRSAERGTVALLVPGDPMIATTHIAIRLALARLGIQSRIIHGASIMSAICGATGLQSYKFGKAITFPCSGGVVPPSVMETIRENRARGLHTLLLLDIVTDTAEQLNIHSAISRMASTEPATNEWLAVGAARVGSANELIKASKAKFLTSIDFGSPPHCIVFPGQLHFMEEEALRVLAGATATDLEVAK